MALKYYFEQFEEAIKEKDFSALRKIDSKEAFRMLGKFTKYKQFVGKREGGLVNCIKIGDTKIYGADMEKEIMNHFKKVHKHPDENYVKPFYRFPSNLPEETIGPSAIIKMFGRFKTDKALGCDGCGNISFR
jgi:hypothetical protein